MGQPSWVSIRGVSRGIKARGNQLLEKLAVGYAEIKVCLPPAWPGETTTGLADPFFMQIDIGAFRRPRDQRTMGPEDHRRPDAPSSERFGAKELRRTDIGCSDFVS
ncbi:hypothetical protein AK812_SmicGene32227 [Symbiodinium microadriaticum]|uniref:Uncharacterized protein n=1 Tax=Symbiodinium microadriaticum TaxID=2951 RepID=A0A1Q9CUQ0_SYMMI|nr:hypothetical protein AK812_SmicGene32227 [Symbiodinium microadriaticum]